MKVLTRAEAKAIFESGEEPTIEALMSQSANMVALDARVTELERRLNQDSHNSHGPSKGHFWPPSRDLDRKPAPHSLRQKTGRKSGGQVGHGP